MILGGFIRYLAALALLLPGLASATAYTGHLVPGKYEMVISITLEMKLREGVITGTASALMPNPTEAFITGTYMAGLCNITVTFRNQTKANLKGNCGQERFEGDYKMFPAEGKKQTGVFNLQADRKARVENTEAEVVDAPPNTAVNCLKRKVSCLTACPRGDYNAEFLCANLCRRKEAVCKGKAKAAAALPPAGQKPPAPRQEEDGIP